MPLIASAPYVPATDAEMAFETYRFYLESIHSCLASYGRWTAFGTLALTATRTLQGLSEPDLSWVERFLRIAWNTEYLIWMGTRDSNLLRFSNQWTPIQCYYAVYGATEAVAYALDGQKANGHEKSLRKVTSYLIRGAVRPWNFAFKGPQGRNGSSHRPLNFPSDLRIPHNLSRAGIRPSDMVAKCLKAEHSNRIDDSWKKGRCRKYEFDPGETGIFHFLYRLRIKSNYRDVDTFINGAPDDRIKSFGDSIRRVTFYALLYLEIILVRKIGKQALLELGDRYLAINQRAKYLEARLEFYRAHV